MKNLRRVSIVWLMVHVLSSALGTSETAFDELRGLRGRWAIRSERKILPIEMSYELGSKGSIVAEQFGKELSVFYRDGQSVVMIHFCNAGNQPRLRLKESSRPDFLEFEMFDITNLKTANADHVQRVIYRILNENTIDLEIVWEGNNSQTSERYSLTRI